ncbi:MAG: transporter substrate-binding domain-containing protein [Anaeromyxobacteraceae bacterium]
MLRRPKAWLLALVLAANAARAQPLEDDPQQAIVVVGGDRSYPPYEFIDASGKPAGFNVELTRAIARTVGLRVDIRLGRWDEMRRRLGAGELDALAGMSFSEERARDIRFTPPTTLVAHSIFGRRDAPRARGFDDLRGREVLVLRGGIMHEMLLQHHPEVRPVPVDTHADVLLELAAGKRDYALMAKLPGLYLVRELRLANLEAMGAPVAVERYGFAVASRDEELVARLSEGLAILKNTGEYQAIHDAWLGPLEPPGLAWREALRWGALILSPLVLLLAGMALWSRTLRRQVALRTGELTREVAERIHAEEELRRNQQQLLQADKMAALGVLVSGVAHEINNPNGLLLVDLQVIADVLADAAPILEEHSGRAGDFTLGGLRWSRLRDALPRLTAEMLDASRRVKRIVEDLKDYARRGDPALHDDVDLNEVVRTALRLVDGLVRRSTDRLALELAPDLPRVRGNTQRLEQVVVNLLVNSCQALPDRSRGIAIRTWAEGGRAWLEVRDEGVGIPPEHLAHVTEPFFTTKRERGGTGLGLAVSASIVKEHAATLGFESTAGAGTAARLSLPVPAAERAA